MSQAEAVARMTLDASSFNKNADHAVKQFIRSTSEIRDAGDLARRGFEAIEKSVIKSFAGGAVLTAAGVFLNEHIKIDAAMKQLGETAEKVLGKAGMGQTFEDAISRSGEFASAAEAAQKQLDEINSNPIAMLVGRLNGATKAAESLKDSLTGVAAAELQAGLSQALFSAQARLGKTPEQIAKMDATDREKAQMDSLRSAAGYKAADPEARKRMEASLVKLQAAQRELKDQAENQKNEKELADFRKKLAQDNADYENKLATDRELDTIQRERAFGRERLEFQKGLERARVEADKMTADRAKAEGANRGIRGIRANAASEELGIISAADPRLAQQIQRERDKQAAVRAEEVKKNFDAAVRANTAELTPEGGQRTMVNRRIEYIQQQVGKEASGGKTLADVYQVLNDAISKITATPMVGAN